MPISEDESPNILLERSDFQEQRRIFLERKTPRTDEAQTVAHGYLNWLQTELSPYPEIVIDLLKSSHVEGVCIIVNGDADFTYTNIQTVPENFHVLGPLIVPPTVLKFPNGVKVHRLMILGKDTQFNNVACIKFYAPRLQQKSPTSPPTDRITVPYIAPTETEITNNDTYERDNRRPIRLPWEEIMIWVKTAVRLAVIGSTVSFGAISLGVLVDRVIENADRQDLPAEQTGIKCVPENLPSLPPCSSEFYKVNKAINDLATIITDVLDVLNENNSPADHPNSVTISFGCSSNPDTALFRLEWKKPRYNRDATEILINEPFRMQAFREVAALGMTNHRFNKLVVSDNCVSLHGSTVSDECWVVRRSDIGADKEIPIPVFQHCVQ